MKVNYFFLYIFFFFCAESVQAQHIELAELEINDDSYSTLNWGTVKQKKTSKKTLQLINTGDKELVITKIEQGCECTNVKIKKKKLAPKESTTVYVKWRPINTSEFYSSFMIHSNAINHPELWVQIEGNVE